MAFFFPEILKRWQAAALVSMLARCSLLAAEKKKKKEKIKGAKNEKKGSLYASRRPPSKGNIA